MCGAPKDGELWLNRVKPAEKLVEARGGNIAEIVQPCLQNEFLSTYTSWQLRQTFYNNMRGANVHDHDSCLDSCTDDESDHDSEEHSDQSQLLCNGRNMSTRFDCDLVGQIQY